MAALVAPNQFLPLGEPPTPYPRQIGNVVERGDTDCPISAADLDLIALGDSRRQRLVRARSYPPASSEPEAKPAVPRVAIKPRLTFHQALDIDAERPWPSALECDGRGQTGGHVLFWRPKRQLHRPGSERRGPWRQRMRLVRGISKDEEGRAHPARTKASRPRRRPEDCSFDSSPKPWPPSRTLS